MKRDLTERVETELVFAWFKIPAPYADLQV